jgi:hypothetical protein
MSLTRALLALAFVLLFCVNLPAQMPPPAASTPAFDQLKSLAGTWEGKRSADRSTMLTYEVVSNGSVVMERLKPTHEAEMVTMYSLDGGRIVVTHYCSMGNQPTMQTAPLAAATGKYDFHFVRIAGTKTPEEGHMTDLTLSLPDKDHLTQTWTFLEKGKSESETFNFTRAK